jgi:hypothetical protein
MHAGRTVASIFFILALASLAGVAAATTMTGCAYIDTSGNGARDSFEPCVGGITLHLKVMTAPAGTGEIRSEQDFTSFSTENGRNGFSVLLPTPPDGQTWYATVVEREDANAGYPVVQPSAPPDGYSDPGYTVAYTAATGEIPGITFGMNTPAAVPVPEFPTVAVSIMVISGMVVATQYLKTRT